jgi:hypothetical protein
LVIADVEVRGLGVYTSDVLDLPRAGEQVDKVQKDAVISWVWSPFLGASSSDMERRLEPSQTSSASVELRDVESLQKKIDKMVWEMRREEGRDEEPKLGGGSPRGHRNHARKVAEMGSSDERFLGLGDTSSREKKREIGGGEGLYIASQFLGRGLGFVVGVAIERLGSMPCGRGALRP